MKSYKQILLEIEESSRKPLIHYSHEASLDNLQGIHYGKGIKGHEAERLENTKDDRIKKRVYFYPKHNDEYPMPEAGLGIHMYEAKPDNMYDSSTASRENRNTINDKTKSYIDSGEHPSNAFERSVLDHGYQGYHTNKMSVVMNQDVPVKYLGTKHGKEFVSNDHVPRKQSALDSLPNKDGEHESGLLTTDQAAYLRKHKDELQAVAPSLKMQYGRMNVSATHMDALKKELSTRKHPF
jgi:hypothetical protein